MTSLVSEAMSSYLATGTDLNGYLIGQCIGTGAYSTVYKATHKRLNKPVAVKVLSKLILSPGLIKREVMLMKMLKHPHCISMLELIETEEHVCIIMEYLPGGTLGNLIKTGGSLPEGVCRHYFVQLISAIQHIHEDLRVVHRDVKSDNILIDGKGNLRLVDFGLSNCIPDETDFLMTSCGSPIFSSPEMLRGKSITKSTDVWSAGVVLYHMAVGCLPFDDENMKKLTTMIFCFEPNYPCHLSAPLISLLKKMLTKETHARITVPEIFDDPWLSNIRVPSFSYSSVQDDVYAMLDAHGHNADLARKAVLEDRWDSIAALYRITERFEVTDRIELEEIPSSLQKNRHRSTRMAKTEERFFIKPLSSQIGVSFGAFMEETRSNLENIQNKRRRTLSLNDNSDLRLPPSLLDPNRGIPPLAIPKLTSPGPCVPIKNSGFRVIHRPPQHRKRAQSFLLQTEISSYK